MVVHDACVTPAPLHSQFGHLVPRISDESQYHRCGKVAREVGIASSMVRLIVFALFSLTNDDARHVRGSALTIMGLEYLDDALIKGLTNRSRIRR